MAFCSFKCQAEHAQRPQQQQPPQFSYDSTNALPPISPTGAGELSRAGQSAADAAFAAPSPTAESILEAPSPSDLPIVSGANLKRSNAITPAIVADGADAGGSHSRHTSGGSAKETVVPPQVDIPSTAFSTGPLTAGLLTPASLRSPLDNVIDSAQASQGHPTPAIEQDDPHKEIAIAAPLESLAASHGQPH